MMLEAWEDLLPITGDTNINVVNFGIQEKDPNHHWGPMLKWEYVLQYVTDGEGYYEVGNKKYTVQKGDMFYLPKDVLVYYRANPNNPYTYYWLGFGGSAVDTILERIGFTVENPVIKFPEEEIIEILVKMEKALTKSSFSEIIMYKGYLYQLLALLLSFSEENNITLQKKTNEYVSRAVSYIKNGYFNNINISTMAWDIGLCRNYLSVIFKKQMGISPVDFLVRYRIDQAKILLAQKISVTDAATLSGFNSVSNFSVQFKRITGQTPSEYKMKAQ